MTATCIMHRACRVGFLGFRGKQESKKSDWQLMFHEPGKLFYRAWMPSNRSAVASANEDGRQFQHFQ